jgi:hypothetical protein
MARGFDKNLLIENSLATCNIEYREVCKFAGGNLKLKFGTVERFGDQ